MWSRAGSRPAGASFAPNRRAMFHPLDALPDTARIWLYTASRPLTDDDIRTADEALRAFAEGWAAHGAPVHGYAGVRERAFLLFAADEARTAVSGCSIDSSVAAVRELGARLDVDFFQRLNLALRTDGGPRLLHRDKLAAAAENGTIGPQTPTYDPMVQTLGQWRTAWVKPLRATWAGAFLPAAAGR